jgi:hypothetical protein
MMLAKAKGRSNKTFIVQASLTIIACDPQYIFINTGHWSHFAALLKSHLDVQKPILGASMSVDAIKCFELVSFNKNKQKYLVKLKQDFLNLFSWCFEGGRAGSRN